MSRFSRLEKLIPQADKWWQAEKRDGIAHAQSRRLEYLKQNESAAIARKKHVQTKRRDFIEMASKAGFSMPLLRNSAILTGLLGARHANAADENQKRVIYCYIPSGSVNGSWLPSSPTAMNTQTTAYGPEGYDVANVCHFREVDVTMPGHSAVQHSMGVVGGYGSDTMDTRLAPILSATNPYSYIYLGADNSPLNAERSNISGSQASNIGSVEVSVERAFKKYFVDAPAGSDDESYKFAFAEQMKAINSIKAKLAGDELERLQVHEAALDKLSSRIETLMTDGGPDLTTCAPMAKTDASLREGSETNMLKHGQAQADILIAAMACGLTNVGTLQLGTEGGHWKAHGIDDNDTAHGAIHGYLNIGRWEKFVEYISGVPAYIIKRLMETDGPDGKKLIDTTVLVQVSCMGQGTDHSTADSPYVVATNMPGFTSGFSASKGGTTFDIHGTVPKAMGIPDNLYTSVGDKSLGLSS